MRVTVLPGQRASTSTKQASKRRECTLKRMIGRRYFVLGRTIAVVGEYERCVKCLGAAVPARVASGTTLGVHAVALEFKFMRNKGSAPQFRVELVARSKTRLGV